jgi:hypothetical protein
LGLYPREIFLAQVLIFDINIQAYPDRSFGSVGLYPNKMLLAQVLIFDINVRLTLMDIKVYLGQLFMRLSVTRSLNIKPIG